MRGRSGWRAALTALALAALSLAALGPARVPATLAGTAPASRPALKEPADSVVARAFRLSGAGRIDSALAIAEGALAARAGHAEYGRMLALRGTLLALADRPKPAEADLRESMRLALESHEGRGYRVSERWLCYALLLQSRLRESDSLYRDLLARSRAAGDAEHEGWALVGLSYASLERGELGAAQPGYARAAAIFDSLGDSNGSLYALTGLGRARFTSGEFEAGARVWRRLIERSRAAGNVRSEAYGWNNLGVSMDVLGDPGEAVRAFQHARELAVRQGHAWDELAAVANIVHQNLLLGDLRQADADLALAIPLAEHGGFSSQLADLLGAQADLRRLQRRPREAIAIARRGLALENLERTDTVADLLQSISNSYSDLDFHDSSLVVLDEQAARLRGRVRPFTAQVIELIRAHELLELGRAREALAAVRRAWVVDPGAAGGIREVRLRALEARALRALGDDPRALASLMRAADVWERARARPQEREWRETFTGRGREVYEQIADLLLREASGPAEVARGFDILQRFKARTLEERVLGPHAERAAARNAAAPRDTAAFRLAAATAAGLQRDVLRQGEVLLDAFVGETSSWLFALSRDTCAVIRLPAAADLRARLARLDRMVSAPAGGDASARTLDETSAALGMALLGPLRPILVRSDRVIFAPDDALHLLPLEALALGEGVATEPLIARREVVRVPSATLFAEFRRRSGGAGVTGELLALAGESDAHGARLAGARREVQSLARDYEGVVAPPRSRGMVWTLGELPRARAIHIAAHSRADDERPWRSGILLGRPDSSGTDPWLRASTIAGLTLGADLAVISACESAGGRVRSGEGIEGLAAAFLSAGVPCVIATLWPVDDASTARLVRVFYRGLAEGETAAAALRKAQLSVRAAAATRHPFYWAGFVLVGEGGTRLKLSRRNTLAAAALPLGAALAGGLALAWALRARRRSRPAGPGRL